MNRNRVIKNDENTRAGEAKRGGLISFLFTPRLSEGTGRRGACTHIAVRFPGLLVRCYFAHVSARSLSEALCDPAQKNERVARCKFPCPPLAITTKPLFKAQNKCQILFDAGGLWLLHRLQSKRKEGRKEKYKVNTVNNLAISKSHFKLGFSFPLPISWVLSTKITYQGLTSRDVLSAELQDSTLIPQTVWTTRLMLHVLCKWCECIWQASLCGILAFLLTLQAECQTAVSRQFKCTLLNFKQGKLPTNQIKRGGNKWVLQRPDSEEQMSFLLSATVSHPVSEWSLFLIEDLQWCAQKVEELSTLFWKILTS